MFAVAAAAIIIQTDYIVSAFKILLSVQTIIIEYILIFLLFFFSKQQ
jgi:hypothetical protein